MTSTSPSDDSVAARFFSGQDGADHLVTLRIEHGRIDVRGDTVTRNDPIEAVVISERIGRTPRFVRFADGAFCEVSDVDRLDAMLGAARISAGAVSQWETSGRLVWILSTGLLGLAIAAYIFGLPFFAQGVANRLPISAVQGLSDQVLATLDRDVFDETQLSAERRAALTTRFSALQWPGPVSIPMRVEFRKSDDMGANALALPAGTIVVTDELIALAKSDDEIIGVLAHEAGHVQERHGLRSIIQSSVVSLAVTWIVGDVSTLIAIAPTALLQAKYSRDLERSADDYAAATLSRNALSTSLLADMLERMEAAHGGRGQFAGPLSYVSTHPATAERIAALRGR